MIIVSARLRFNLGSRAPFHQRRRYNAATRHYFTTVSALFSVIWQPFLVGAIVLFYYDLRIRKGYDLELRVQQLEAASTDDSDDKA
ncbi:MAG: hypothetical protein R2911_37190 [Caldilineaceae bacterium]